MSNFTVTTAASNLSLLTVEELRAAAGVSDTGHDMALAELGQQLSTALARRCMIVDDGVHPPTLLSEGCTEVFRWNGCGPLSMARRPVTEIASVSINGAAIDASGYELANGRNLHRLSGDALVSWPTAKITVVYTAGFLTVPPDLKLAASKLATALYKETARDPNLKREDIPGIREVEYWVAPTTDPLLSREISDLLAPYVERWI